MTCERSTVGSPPAVVNAVVDAIRSYGVNDILMPCTPERVWRAINHTGGGRADPTEESAEPHFVEDGLNQDQGETGVHE